MLDETRPVSRDRHAEHLAQTARRPFSYPRQSASPSFRNTVITTVICAVITFIGLEMAEAEAQTRTGEAPAEASIRTAASSAALNAAPYETRNAARNESGNETQGQSANGTRRIPGTARLGVLSPGVFPQATLDGDAITLGPGFRLMDTLDRIVVPASVLGTRQVVAYQTGPLGELAVAWILTAAERNAIRRRQ